MTNFITDDLINANVRVKYSGASKSVPNATVPIDFDTPVYNEGFETISGGEFTIPVDGQYQIQLAIELTGSSNAQAVIYVDGNEADNGGTSQNLVRHRCSSVLDLTKGQTVSGRFPNTTTTSAISELNYLAITRIPQYSAGEPAGFGLATETQAGLVKAQSRYCYMGHGVNQGTIPDGQQTIVEYSTVVEDVHGMADTINHRIIPNLPGIYFCSARVYHLVNGTNFVSSSAQIRKNGVTFAQSGNVFNTLGNSINNVTGAALVMAGAQVFNGTTDYIDVNMACDVVNGGPTWELPDGGTTFTYLQAVYIGPLPSLT